MITITRENVYGFETAVRGMRNPLNSWKYSDSIFLENGRYQIGEKDLILMQKLAEAGNDHGKFLRMIHVSCDICAPLYWWKEMDTYKVGTVANSCSTMHKIHEREFTDVDFSTEHLLGKEEFTNADEFDNAACLVTIKDPDGDILAAPSSAMTLTIRLLNRARELFLETKDKKYWWQMIQLLPSSYNQLRTWEANYAVLKNIYHARKNHKLDEWHTFCSWIETLPYSDLITK